MLRDVLIILAVLVVYLGWAHANAYRECRWCRRGGPAGGSLPARIAGYDPRRRRRARGRCWRCKGRRQTRRWAAWATHKLAVSLRHGWDEWSERQ